jgi:hypothetical protein
MAGRIVRARADGLGQHPIRVRRVGARQRRGWSADDPRRQTCPRDMQTVEQRLHNSLQVKSPSARRQPLPMHIFADRSNDTQSSPFEWEFQPFVLRDLRPNFLRKQASSDPRCQKTGPISNAATRAIAKIRGCQFEQIWQQRLPKSRALALMGFSMLTYSRGGARRRPTQEVSAWLRSGVVNR